MMGLYALALGVTLASLPAKARSEQHWCVGQEYPNALSNCPETCANVAPLESVAAAVNAIEEFESTSSGSGENHHICFVEPGPQELGLSLNLQSAYLGRSLAIHWLGQACPSGELPPGAPMISISADPLAGWRFQLALDFMGVSAFACEQSGAVLHVSGPADIVFGSAALAALPGPLVTLESQGGEPSVTFENSLIEGTLGPLVVGTGDVHVVETEVSASMSEGGGAIIDTELGSVTLRHSAIFASVVEGAPLVRTTGPLLITESFVANNIVGGGSSLLDAQAFPVAAAPAGQGLHNSVFSNNSLVVAGGSATAATLPDRTGGLLQQPCLPYGSLGFAFDGRDTPQSNGLPSDSPILTLTGAAPGAEFSITRTFFVETSAGPDAATVALASEGSAIWLTLLHNTIGASTGRLVAGAGAPTGTHVSAARNLLTTAFSIETNPQWAGIESSLDLDLSGTEPPPAAPVGLSILGPYLYGGDILPQPWFHADVATWSHWERVRAACPDLPEAGPGQDLWALPCLLGSAANYVPTQDFIDAYAQPWPWESAFFGDFPVGHPSNTPGATGWACRGVDPAPYDNHIVGGFGVGDGDGFSSLLDCANEDDAIGPALPDPDGFGESECLEAEGDCFRCPEGSEPPGDDDSGDDDSATEPPADDDSSTDTPGDDDSASAVDDPPPSDDAPIHYIHTGCGQHKGCGVAFSCDDGGLSLAVLLPLWARRGRRRPQQRSGR